ncbi:hypothetical protein [Akkermansia glycaniphila]|uniref:His-Xaa-Ser system protein HxsD n=1 Tax=Akkermansia glycaniphila TaxID=1679444 RepID=A0A1H6MCW9_9BACT|nr:hypothetical protein [Akkermansia glycaniphila]SEH99398.1 Hypothetical protein PYTT_2388 [Akkermansia glycaniphila]
MSEPLKIILDGKIYEKEAIFAACRELSPFASINILSPNTSDIVVEVTPLAVESSDPQDFEQKLRTLLIDSQIRLDLNKQFGVIRDIIVKQAFAPIANLDEELKKIQ